MSANEIGTSVQRPAMSVDPLRMSAAGKRMIIRK